MSRSFPFRDTVIVALPLMPSLVAVISTGVIPPAVRLELLKINPHRLSRIRSLPYSATNRDAVCTCAHHLLYPVRPYAADPDQGELGRGADLLQATLSTRDRLGM